MNDNFKDVQGGASHSSDFIQKEKDIQSLLEKHLPAKTAEKEALGEVFSPISMIETLLQQFPSSIWKNKNMKWIDPACGIGNFPITIFFHYMKSLTEIIPNPTTRAKHIIENMLYMVEINPDNYKVCRSIFRELCPSATPNIFQGDFLQHSSINGVNIKGFPTYFDCVIGNPPYNIGGTKLEGTKRVHIVFAEHGLMILSKNGYLGFISPPNYRESGSTMNDLFRHYKGHFIFIRIYGSDETHRLFNIQARVDSFIFKKDSIGQTFICDEFGVEHHMNIDLHSHIPNFGNEIFEKLKKQVAKLGKIDAFRITEMSTTKANQFGCGSHKLLHLIVKKGRRIYKTRKKHSLSDKPKILVNGLGVPYVFYDNKGVYGMSQSPVVILEPTKNLANFLQSNLFNCIALGLRLTGNNNLPYLFDYVPDVRKTKLNFKDDKDFVSFLGLTQKELKFINQHCSVPTYTDKDIVEPCIDKNTRLTRKLHTQ